MQSSKFRLLPQLEHKPLQFLLQITVSAFYLAALEMGLMMLSLFVFSNKFIVLHGPLELNNASNDLDFEKDDV